MTIEKANKDFNQLIEQNGFINTGAKTPTGCEVYSREWSRKVQIAWYGESTDTLVIKIWISCCLFLTKSLKSLKKNRSENSLLTTLIE